MSFGTAHCSISTDTHVSEVDPLTCQNCEIPGIIAKPRCRFLSLGTELKPHRGEGRLVPAMACRALGIKLYSLSTCAECSLYSEVDSLADLIKVKQELAEIQLPMRESLVEQIARDIRTDYGAFDEEAPRPQPIRCWRFPEGRCRKSPIYTRGKATILLTNNTRNNEVYSEVIVPALRDLKLQPFRVDIEINGAEEMCYSCENIQESDFVILSLDDWSTNSVFLSGITYGTGRRLTLIKNDSLQPVPLAEHMEHDVLRYEQLSELKQRLKDHLRPYVQAVEP